MKKLFFKFKSGLLSVMFLLSFSICSAQWTPPNNPENIQANPIFVHGTITDAIYFGKGAGTPAQNINCIAIGRSALTNNTGGASNIAIGSNALESNTSGSQNVALGTDVLRLNTTGEFITAIGVEAMRFSNGSNNTVSIGYRSFLNAQAAQSVAVGSQAGEQITNATNTVAIGRLAMQRFTNSTRNTACGDGALQGNLTGTVNGQNNSAFGVSALGQISSGNDNVGIGFGAGGNITIGVNNIAIGSGALTGVTSGSSNVAIGRGALDFTVGGPFTGSQNVAIGLSATLPNNTSNGLSIQNVIYGTNMSTGTNGRVAIGGPTAPTSLSSIYPSSTAKLDVQGTLRVRTVGLFANPGNEFLFVDAQGMVGRATLPSYPPNIATSKCSTLNFIPKVETQGSNGLVCSQIFDDGTSVGIFSVGPFTYSFGAPPPFSGGTVPASGTVRLDVNGVIRTIGIFATSDKRMKKEITQIEDPIKKISKISGYTYYWDKGVAKNKEFDNGRHAGFLAQEVEKILPEAVSINSDGIYGLDYNAIMPLLAEGIKAQQQQITEQQMEIEILKTELAEMKKGMLNISRTSVPGITHAKLEVAPNPVTGVSVVSYTIEENNQGSLLVISDLQGKIVKQLALQNKQGQLQVNKKDLAAGMYIFSVINGNTEVLSKKVLVSK